jgi:hypothetical protein
MLKRNYFSCSLLFLILLITLTSISAQEQKRTVDDTKMIPSALSKVASNFDRGIAYMDAGVMQVNGVENYGMIGYRGFPYCKHGFWGELRWIIPFLAVPPQPWATNILHDDLGSVDRSMNYNCIESISMYFGVGVQGLSYSDWEARDNSRTQLMGIETDANNVPLIATSTRPDSWPEGFWNRDSNSEFYGQFIETPAETHWPGYWAIDPDPLSPTYGQQIPGEFVSDKDIFFIMDDKYNGIRSGDEVQTGYPIGFDMEVSGYCYSTKLYEDIVFFNYNLIYRDNISDPSRQYHDGEIDSLYFGFFIDPDLPGRDPEGYTMDPWAEDDYCYADTERNIFLMYDKDGYDQDDDDINSEGPVSAYAIAYLKSPQNKTTGDEVGLTGYHWFTQEDFDAEPSGQKMEKIMYAMASNKKDILSSQDQEKYFHGDDPNFDDLELLRDAQENDPIGQRIDVLFLMSSGPFSVAPGDTLPLHFCIVGGKDNPGALDAEGFPINPYEVRFEDVLYNFDKALELYGNSFRGTGPPKRPTLKAVGTETIDENGLPVIYAEDGKVTLYWDDIAEKSVDLITKQTDFEGYKIYKAYYDPGLDYVDWGQEVYEINSEGGLGDIVSYEPVFQCDLKNDYQGLDPFRNWFYLGSNSGITHTFTDTDIKNGIRYRYAITAYDRYYDDEQFGFNANETAKGNSPRDINVIDVIPGVRPTGFVPASIDSAFQRISGVGNGSIELELIDDNQIAGHSYILSFDDTSNSALLYNVYDENEGIYKVTGALNIVSESSGEEPDASPIFDGIGLKIINNDEVEALGQGWTTITGDTSTYQIEVTRFFKVANQADYEIRFLGPDADTSMIGTKTVPFQIWNVSEIPPVKVTPVLSPRTGDFMSGDKVIFNEQIDPLPARLTPTWEIEFDFVKDSVELAPSVGDIYKIVFKKSFTSDDQFLFSTYKLSEESITSEMLKEINVVPNPYVVSSRTELYSGSSQWNRHEVRFTHLPPKCTITIYTLTGDHVKTIKHDNSSFGEARWDLLTKENLEVSYGIYVYVVKTPEEETFIGKLAVIK